MDGYYDGIPEKIKKMTIEEIEEAIKIEEKKCEIMDKNSKQLGGIMDDKKNCTEILDDMERIERELIEQLQNMRKIK